MHWTPRRWTLVGMLLLILLMMTPVAAAQVTTTQVADTIYRADGSTATGTAVISWPDFTTASGQTISAGSTSATIGADGALSVQLAPNAGSNPMGSYYTVIYHLDDGSVSRQYWVVPASGAPVKISAISSTVLPLSVAQQTASKSYVDTAIAQAVSGVSPEDSSSYVLKTGDTMTGPLVLPGDPTAATQAADKHYVDTSTQQVVAGLGQKVSLLPQATQAVSQPTGTQLNVNNLNSVEYAGQYVTGLGNNGIANAANSADCASGCDIKVGRDYDPREGYAPSTWNDQTHLEDHRLGARWDSYVNPVSRAVPSESIAQSIDLSETKLAAVKNGAVVGNPFSAALTVTNRAMAGGTNLFPTSIESNVPYFKSTYVAEVLNGIYNTIGQHAVASHVIDCYGVGDCLIGQQSIVSSGGLRDEADEGAHPFDLDFYEDTRVFGGTCSSGCTTGSTSVTIGNISAAKTQGEGRYLIDKNPAKTMTTGSIIGSGTDASIYPEAMFSGTSFPISVFFATAQAAISQVNDMAPGTVTLPIATSGVTPGFATNTAAAPSPSGVACIANQNPVGGFLPSNYEMANYTVVDGTHIQLTLNKPHAAQSTIAIGGLCGYGLEQTVDTQNGIRQVFPVVGSFSSTGLYYAGGLTFVIGRTASHGGYANISSSIVTVARNSNVVTLTAAGNFPQEINGLSMTIAGVADSSYNGTFTVTTTGPNTLTYTQSGPNSTSTGGTLSYVTGSYVLYPIAEVLSVMNPATKLIDGQLTLAPNTVPWAPGDVVEQPHYFQTLLSSDTEFVGQTMPRPVIQGGGGITYQGTNTGGLVGWQVTNATPATQYLGDGGTHVPPATAISVLGPWQETMNLAAGRDAVFHIHCNYHNCDKWNSGYDLFRLEVPFGYDTIHYHPHTQTLSMSLAGIGYSFSPQSFTAPTINATTINATTINGSVSGSSITSGSVNAAYLPQLGASGSSHAAGIVPDPGPSGGKTRFLREDGTWNTPSISGRIVTGALADYNFEDGSGSSLADASGNGNNGTLAAGTNAPVWTPNSLAFSGQQGVSLPTALNGAQTWFFGACTTPLGATSRQQGFYLSSSLGSSGFNVLNQTLYPNNGGWINDSYAPSLLVNGMIGTSAPTPTVGCHVVALVEGTGGSNLDHFYVDGTEVSSYALQSASAGTQTTGNLYLGSSNQGYANAWTFTGQYYRVLAYASQLSAADVQANSLAVASDMASRGASFTPVPIMQTGFRANYIGDSITAGTGGSTPYPTLVSLANQPAYTSVNWGIYATDMATWANNEAMRVGPQCKSSNGGVIAVVMGGTNDLHDIGGATPQTVFASTVTEVQALKSAGCKVFVGTILSRGGNANSGATMDAAKDELDQLITGSILSYGADGVVDFAANPLLGADNAYSNTTYFNTDLTHPTNAGYALMGTAASNALNYWLTPYTRSNPHTVTTSYAMAAGDQYVTANPTANQTLTLPDCTGQSGALYTVTNLQSAFTVGVVTGSSEQLINGLAVGTPVVVPSNGSVTFRDVPNPRAVSGCHWEK